MSAFLGRVHQVLDDIKAEFEHLLGHGEADVQVAARNAVERIDAAKAEIEKDAPQLERDAETDAVDVAKTAATQGIAPAEQKAVAEGTALVVEAGHDAAKAAEAAARTPAQTAAVIAAETAVADSGHHA